MWKIKLSLLLYFVISGSPLLADSKNGFDLSDALIPAEEILQGGPPRDGIPSIDNPVFIKANEADFLDKTDRVLAIDYKGKTRAYPIKILNWHEIVNDKIRGESVVVTFCPLCGTGLVYSGDIDGVAHKFGVSGLLYNSDVLLYDRETQSLWSQILSKSISGHWKGKSLESIPVSHTSWGSWLEKHPNTNVLSDDTGFHRSYSKSPYADYDSNESIYFPLSAKSRRYHPKERVIGINIDGTFKAYPFIELAKTDSSPVNDTLSDQQLTIQFDIENRDGQVLDKNGEILESINSFWFAWYAFHPDTLVYEARN